MGSESDFVANFASHPNPKSKSKQEVNLTVTATDDKTNRCSSVYMRLCASYFAAPLVAVKLNYKSVTKSCVFTDHFNQGNFYFCDNTNVFTYFRLIIPTIS